MGAPLPTLAWGDPLAAGLADAPGKGLLETVGTSFALPHPAKVRGDAVDLGDIAIRWTDGVALGVTLGPVPLPGPLPQVGLLRAPFSEEASSGRGPRWQAQRPPPVAWAGGLASAGA